MGESNQVEIKPLSEADLSLQEKINTCMEVAKHDIIKEFEALDPLGRTEEADFEVLRRHCPLISRAIANKMARERLYQKNVAIQEAQEIIKQVFKIHEDSG